MFQIIIDCQFFIDRPADQEFSAVVFTNWWFRLFSNILSQQVLAQQISPAMSSNIIKRLLMRSPLWRWTRQPGWPLAEMSDQIRVDLVVLETNHILVHLFKVVETAMLANSKLAWLLGMTVCIVQWQLLQANLLEHRCPQIALDYFVVFRLVVIEAELVVSSAMGWLITLCFFLEQLFARTVVFADPVKRRLCVKLDDKSAIAWTVELLVFGNKGLDRDWSF